MKVINIHPNGGFFLDKTDDARLDAKVYNGIYGPTPIYPNYTFQTKRFSSINEFPEITFYTMLPVKRFFMDYLIACAYSSKISVMEHKHLEEIIKNFNLYCHKMIKDIDPSKLLIIKNQTHHDHNS